MTDILDLEGWTVLDKTTDEDGFDVLDAEYRPHPTACQKCGSIGNLYRHGTKLATYMDAPNRGNPSKLRAKVQRYKCRDCGETFLQPLGGIQTERRMTERCAAYIRSMCLRDTFVRVAEHVGCDSWTIRSLTAQYIAELEACYHTELPVWLGIDETQIAGEMRLVLTDVGHRKPIEMLASRDKAALTSWLHHFKDRSMVRGVSTDMWRPYLQVSKHMLPGIPVVVDKFHVVRTASYCMEKVRIRLQKGRKAGERREWLRSKAILNMRYAKLSEKQRFNLDMWMANEEELAEAYKLKESFYDIYDMPKDEAVAAFDAFVTTIPARLKTDFKVLTTAMKNWRTEILAYFDYPITNAYTESLNGVAKTINRAGRGYSYEVLRARLLFGKKAKPGGEPWKLAMAAPASKEQVRILRDMLGNRCMACGLKYGRAQWSSAHIATVVKAEDRRQVLLCAGCFETFHTGSQIPEDRE